MLPILTQPIALAPNAVCLPGDILETTGAILVPVRAASSMGAGLATRVGLRYPSAVEAWIRLAMSYRLQVGRSYYVPDCGRQGLILLPVRPNGNAPARLSGVEAGLWSAVALCASRRITRVALPRIGCGSAGLQWPHVQDMLQRLAAAVPWLALEIYARDPLDANQSFE